MRLNKRALVFGTAAIVTMAFAACGGKGISAGEGDQSGDEHGGDSTRGAPAAELARDEAAPRAAATAASKAGGAPAPAGGNTASTGSNDGSFTTVAQSSASLDRKIIFNARLDLTVDDVPATFGEIGRLVKISGGFVERSALAARRGSDGDERPYATLTLRVPSSEYHGLLTSLRGLPGAKIGKEESGSNEVTEQYTDLESRLRNLERSEAQYLRLLEQAKTIQEILTVNERIDGIRLQIERIQGQMKVLDDLVDLATVEISLAPVIPGKTSPKDDGPKSPAEAFAEAWDWSLDAARYVAAGGAAAAAVAIWLAIPGAMLFGGATFARRRRPHAAP